MDKKRDAYNIATDIDDVIIGLERSYCGFNLLCEAVEEEMKTPLLIKERLEYFMTVAYLCRDRVFDELERLKKLNEELFNYYLEQKPKKEVDAKK